MAERRQYKLLRQWWTDDAGERWRVPNSRGRLRCHFIALHARLRDFILHRDGYRCRSCGTRYAPFVIDHVRSIRNGGTHHPSNLQCLCKRCNDRKAQLVDRRFQRKRRAA